jgi:hypothetical protein
MSRLDIDHFKQRITQTVGWCRLSLNDPDLINAQPDRLGVIEVSPGLFRKTVPPPEHELLVFDQEAMRDFAERVFVSRRTQLNEAGLQLTFHEIQPIYTQGRLIVFFPRTNLDDGVAMIESKDYFNERGFPPWDTWIDFVENDNKSDANYDFPYIISWVPEKLINNVAMAIKTIPDYSIRWVSDILSEFEYLREIPREMIV